MQKSVTEPYLVDALSFTEAEARIIEEMRPFISGEFSVSDIKRVKYTESFFNDSGDRYYRAKLHFITLDEKSGAEKKTSVYMLVQASTLKEAVEIVEAEMKKSDDRLRDRRGNGDSHYRRLPLRGKKPLSTSQPGNRCVKPTIIVNIVYTGIKRTVV